MPENPVLLGTLGTRGVLLCFNDVYLSSHICPILDQHDSAVSSLCTNFLPQDMSVFSLSLELHGSIKTGRSGCKLEPVAPCYCHYYHRSFASVGLDMVSWFHPCCIRLCTLSLHSPLFIFLNVFSLFLWFPNIWSFTFVALFVSVKCYVSSGHPPFPPYVINITQSIM